MESHCFTAQDKAYDGDGEKSLSPCRPRRQPPLQVVREGSESKVKKEEGRQLRSTSSVLDGVGLPFHVQHAPKGTWMRDYAPTYPFHAARVLLRDPWYLPSLCSISPVVPVQRNVALLQRTRADLNLNAALLDFTNMVLCSLPSVRGDCMKDPLPVVGVEEVATHLHDLCMAFRTWSRSPPLPWSSVGGYLLFLSMSKECKPLRKQGFRLVREVLHHALVHSSDSTCMLLLGMCLLLQHSIGCVTLNTAYLRVILGDGEWEAPKCRKPHIILKLDYLSRHSDAVHMAVHWFRMAVKRGQEGAATWLAFASLISAILQHRSLDLERTLEPPGVPKRTASSDTKEVEMEWGTGHLFHRSLWHQLMGKVALWHWMKIGKPVVQEGKEYVWVRHLCEVERLRTLYMAENSKS